MAEEYLRLTQRKLNVVVKLEGRHGRARTAGSVQNSQEDKISTDVSDVS
jgi:hypothetical protein